MGECGSIWEGNSPPPLLHLTARYAVLHLDTVLPTDTKDLHLPTEVGEKLFRVASEEGLDTGDTFVRRLRHITRVHRAVVRGSSLTDRGLHYLLRHKPREVDVSGCPALTPASLAAINRHSDHLTTLTLGNSTQVLPDYLQQEDTFSDSEEDMSGNIYHRQGFILRAPSLRRLSIQGLYINRGPHYLDLLLKPLPRLTHLDLSSTHHNQGMSGYTWLAHLPLLASLTLHNCRELEQALEPLTSLPLLRHLDLSQAGEPRGTYSHPSHFLEGLVTHLTRLESLDISGTNLAGSGPATDSPGCSVRGLASRVSHPLSFLGLYKTRHSAAAWPAIPATTIAGDANEAQILEAGRRYMDRPTVLENILNDLFHVFRYETCRDLRGALGILLLAMERHNQEKHIQISGSASLYYVVKSEVLRRDWTVRVKGRILTTLLAGMLTHREDPTMMRNGCLTLCQFQIPQDVLRHYERLVKILLHIVSSHTTEENNFIQRAGIFLLNSLACQVDGAQKQLVGSLGAIERMLGIITEKLQAGLCDDVMETAWSTMWNVTDETPINCERFLAGGGMHLFLKCKEKFPDKADLLRNMMGLLGNVAEVPELRHRLMTREFVEEFSFLLDSHSDGIEVSYNAAGVLAHMASDGAEAWTVRVPEREFVLSRMVRAVNRWDLTSARNINYRSFAPIIRLVGASHTAECQLWGVWALANLTTVSPGKYCQLVEEEGGLALVEEISNNNTGREEVEEREEQVKALALTVRSNVVRWREREREGLQYDG